MGLWQRTKAKPKSSRLVPTIRMGDLLGAAIFEEAGLTIACFVSPSSTRCGIVVRFLCFGDLAPVNAFTARDSEAGGVLEQVQHGTFGDSIKIPVSSQTGFPC